VRERHAQDNNASSIASWLPGSDRPPSTGRDLLRAARIVAAVLFLD
jgi:hypothetical protein